MFVPRAIAAARLIGRLLIGCFGIAFVLTRLGYAEDPPRRVGSLNYISGEVAYTLRGEAGEPGAADALSWSQADFNQPVCQDMSLKTGAMARARVRIGPDAIQMSGDTWLNMLNLTDQLIEASIRYGRVYLQLSKLDPGESVEFELPRGSLWLLQPGAYDIETGTGDQPTRIVVFEGKARFVGGAADLPIAAGKAVQVSGNYPAIATTESNWTGINPASVEQRSTTLPNTSALTPPNPTPSSPTSPLHEPTRTVDADQMAVAPSNPAPPAPEDRSIAPSVTTAPQTADGRSPPLPNATQLAAVEGPALPEKSSTAATASGQKSSDEFLLWVEESDQDQQPQAPHQSSTRYVSAETTGSDTLDRYGRWDTLPDSEPVWFPTSVPADWAPYRFGHWDWIEPWGWTWIDDQPWGFAPFHYGRWVNIDDHWGWVPGAVESHPVYAPALVAFVDAPDDAGNGPDGGPDVGWFPLGPGDDYAPWYQAGPDYIESVNAPEHRHLRDWGLHGYGRSGREAWRAEYFNRRFATVVSRETFAAAHRIDRGIMRTVAADRLEHAAVMRGAPHITPAVFRTRTGPGEFHGEPRVGMSAPGAGGLRARPGGSPALEHVPGAAARGGATATERGLRPQQAFGRSEAGHAAVGNRDAAARYERLLGPHGAPQAIRAGERQVARPQVFKSSSEGYHAGGQQFRQPQISQGFHSTTPQFSQPRISQGFHGDAQQFGRPQAAAGFRGGAQQFGRPQVFQSPAASYRGGGITARPAPQIAARPAAHVGSGGGGRHK